MHILIDNIYIYRNKLLLLLLFFVVNIISYTTHHQLLLQFRQLNRCIVQWHDATEEALHAYQLKQAHCFGVVGILCIC
jgi:hypothetical protein